MGVSSMTAIPLAQTSLTVSLTADNTAVDPNGYTLLLISSDNTTATNRTFTLAANANVGAMLYCVFTSGASTTAELADTGIQKLSAAWTPVQYGTLTLISDGTNWIELARSAN